MDVGGFRRDKHFLEKSMEALKTRNVELEPLVQTLQVGYSIFLLNVYI